MKLNLSSLVPAVAFAFAMATPVDARLGLFGGDYADAKTESMQDAGTDIVQAEAACEQKVLDICIAVDRSGSICAPPGSSTYSCGGDPNCGCENWDTVRNFTYAFIDGVNQEAARQFALVKFATTSSVESALGSAAVTMDAVENLRYTSGWTNTSDAIADCRELLKGSDAEKTIVLITDGAPTLPLDPDGPSNNYDFAREKALEQAMTAKEQENTTIVGVFVNTTSGTLSFLEELTTPDLSIKVSDFDMLEETVASLVDIVQCPPPPPAPTPPPTLPPRICEQQDVDICIAVDRSGSVCSDPGGPYPKCDGDPNCGDDCPEWNSSIGCLPRTSSGLYH